MIFVFPEKYVLGKKYFGWVHIYMQKEKLLQLGCESNFDLSAFPLCDLAISFRR